MWKATTEEILRAIYRDKSLDLNTQQPNTAFNTLDDDDG